MPVISERFTPCKRQPVTDEPTLGAADWRTAKERGPAPIQPAAADIRAVQILPDHLESNTAVCEDDVLHTLHWPISTASDDHHFLGRHAGC